MCWSSRNAEQGLMFRPAGEVLPFDRLQIAELVPQRAELG